MVCGMEKRRFCTETYFLGDGIESSSSISIECVIQYTFNLQREDKLSIKDKMTGPKHMIILWCGFLPSYRI